MDTSYHKPRETTLLDLLVELQALGPYSEESLVALALSLIRSGSVVLCGTYSNRQHSPH